MTRLAPLLLTALALAASACLSGCPAESKSDSAAGVAPAQRTANVERGQVQARLDAIAKAKTAEDEATAVKALRLWLIQRRPWRSERYRVRVAVLKEKTPGTPLVPGDLPKLKAGQRLRFEVPYFPPTVPTLEADVLDPASFAVLEDVLLD